MPQPATPREVFHTLVDGVSRMIAGEPDQVERLAQLYAEQTHVVHPMAPLGGAPLVTRDDLRRHFAEGPGMAAGRLRGFHATDIVIHDTTDPEVIVAEFTYRGDGDNGPFAVPCVFILRVHDGKIVASRDYADHLGFARIGGRLDELFTQLKG